MTEPITCTHNQRKSMYELLFEAYQVPKVSFGIDSLFSYYANSSGKSSGLVIGAGNQTTSIIPVLNGKGIMSQAKRIDWGGDQLQQYLSKLLTLKYPYFPSKLNSNHTTNLFKDYCYVLKDYQQEVSHILDMDILESKDVVVQAPVEMPSQMRKRKLTKNWLNRLPKERNKVRDYRNRHKRSD